MYNNEQELQREHISKISRDEGRKDPRLRSCIDLAKRE